ncbi:hypothetical protein [Peribacillus sp. RS7]|uniref:hypothetical protein n=1 Tax=Peribacillus sp. RS7 TaxID=3242679 RepID=UPI0035C25211
MKKQKSLMGLGICLIATLFISGCVGNKDEAINKPLIVNKNGLVLKAELNQEQYAYHEKIMIKAEIKNTNNKPYIFKTNDSCDTRFNVELNELLERDYEIESLLVDGKGLMAMGQDELPSKSTKQLIITVTPKSTINELMLKGEERYSLAVTFKGAELKVMLPVECYRGLALR